MLLIPNLLTTHITDPTLLLLYISQHAIRSRLLWRLKIIKAERDGSKGSWSHGILQRYPYSHLRTVFRRLPIRMEKV